VPEQPPTTVPLFAEVVLNLPVDLALTYAVPAEFAADLKIGQKVLVPLGGTRAAGFVVAFPAPVPARPPRPLIRILDQRPLFPEPLVALVSWMAKYYFCSFARALKCALPAAVRKVEKTPVRRFVSLALSAEELSALMAKIEKKAPSQIRILKVLQASKVPVEAKELLAAAAAGPEALSALSRKGAAAISTQTAERDSWAGEKILPTAPLDLNPEQVAALARIEERIEKGGFQVFLLHGITGSGKTEIYLQAIARVLRKGKSVIVLVPEISLTPQAGERFKARFGDEVAILHSALSEGERHDQWRRVAEGRARIVVGPRSAVFAPVRALGLIVVDEEHETSYKQSAQSPFYHARDLAVMRAKIEGAPAVLGSATPSLESYYNCRRGKYELLHLPARPGGADLPQVTVVDMKAEVEREGRVVTFSRRLLDAIQLNLSEGRQTILFLNRRGFHTLATCRACGWVAQCNHCSISLAYHKARQILICHLCGFTAPPPTVCPSCHKREVSLTGLGTQRVEEQLHAFFPGARVRRMDTDTVSFRDAHREILSEFKAGKIDILVGTQMIAKGLDYPNVTLVGVVFADTALSLADFRATEYTFQVLTQVTGRSGRGELKGRVIVQTYSPRHPAILAASRQEFEPFFEREIVFREELRYPPTSHLLAVTVLSPNEEKSRRMAEFLARRLGETVGKESEVLGPSPPPIARIKGRWRWQVVIKTSSVVPALEQLKTLIPSLHLPRDVRVEVDVDPVSML
jgi:primosomal protein N' (replication factor Y)